MPEIIAIKMKHDDFFYRKTN